MDSYCQYLILMFKHFECLGSSNGVGEFDHSARKKLFVSPKRLVLGILSKVQRLLVVAY